MASSLIFGYCKEYLPQRLGRTLDDVRESFTNFITSQELMAARRNRPFQLVCSVCFSHFRPRDGSPENCFFQMASVHVHPRAYVCIINESQKANSLIWENKTYKLNKSIVKFLFLCFLACDTEMQEGITHTHKEK